MAASLIAFAYVPTVQARGTLDQQQDVHEPIVALSPLSSYLAQTFTPGVSGTLDTVELSLCLDLPPYYTDTANVRIESVASGLPTGTVLATAAPMTLQSPSCEWIPFSFGAPAQVMAGTPYAIVMLAPTPYWSFSPQASGDLYPAGQALSNGSVYSDPSDFAFRTYVTGRGRPACLVSNQRTRHGSRSLQDGIDAAAPGDTLIVKGTCVGSSSVTKDLTIRGASNAVFGASTPILDGGSAGRVLVVETDQEVTIADLTITHGLANDGNPGGGLFARTGSVAILRNVTVTANRSEIEGGGVFVETDGSMAIEGSSVTGNSSGPYGMGGGIGNGWKATLTITNSTVTGNQASIGGGIANLNGVTTITESTVSGNNALQGGGISSDYGGTLRLTDSTVAGNTADHLGGGLFNGLMNYLTGRHSTMTIDTSLVSGNTSGASGGGIENRGDMTLVGSTVSGNSGVNCGGGISNYLGTLDIVDSSVSRNTAVCAGGIANSSAAMTITGSTVSGNSATVSGGGLLNAASMLDAPTTMTISNSTVRGNAAAYGGGVLNFGLLTFASPPTTVGGNTATTGGGVLQVATSPVNGSVAGGCPVSLGGNVVYRPKNTPTNYDGFTC